MSTVVHHEIILDTTGSHNFITKKTQLKIVQFNSFLEIKTLRAFREKVHNRPLTKSQVHLLITLNTLKNHSNVIFCEKKLVVRF